MSAAFDLGLTGPGGTILVEPELHLGHDVLVPDLAGWRGQGPVDGPFVTLVPDWVCEVLSPSTRALDRGVEMAIYLRERVDHLWLIDPAARLLEVYRRAEDRWEQVQVYSGEALVFAEPFEASGIELGSLFVSGGQR